MRLFRDCLADRLGTVEALLDAGTQLTPSEGVAIAELEPVTVVADSDIPIFSFLFDFWPSECGPLARATVIVASARRS
jgi:hypothetical protein